MPIWVKFFGIPVEYCTTEGLSHVASFLDVLLYDDEPTMNVTRMNLCSYDY